MVSKSLSQKYDFLLQNLSEMEKIVVAFSGGVDSTFLLHAAQEALSVEVLAITLSTPYVPDWEKAEAVEFASSHGVDHLIIDLPFPEEIRNNPADHCYTCKKHLFGNLLNAARERGISYVLDGTNVDDLSDYRPGLKALQELNIRSPLMDAGLGKDEIRVLSKHVGLPTWDKPSFACLLSRLPANVKVMDEELKKVEKAEVFLMNIGFPAVRVRSYGEMARIEVPADRIIELIEADEEYGIKERFKKLGYRHTAVDMDGYRMGSMNKIS